MRLESRHHQQQQPLHLQVTRTQNGKFLVSPNSSPDPHHHQPHQQQFTYQPSGGSHHHHHHNHHNHRHHHHNHHSGQQQQQQQQQQQNQLQQPAANNGNNGNDKATPAHVVPAPVAFTSCEPNPTPQQDAQGPTILGDRFLLLGTAEGSTLYKCVDVQTGQQLVAKALTLGDKSTDALLQAHLRLEGTGAASGVAGAVDAGRKRYLMLEGHHGDLHAYVRARRRLREPEARRLFRQAARAVATCHESGVILRDLKLRKFVFADEDRTQLRLESLEDAVLVDEDDDRLSDRRGCPAYVAPEVLRSGRAYSGKAADIWSLGVLLYTMLVGRYPFNDAEHATLFAKISRGQFAVPEALSPRARCLVRALLRREPSERPVAEDVLRHPWLTRERQSPVGCHARVTSASSGGPGGPGQTSGGAASLDQLVPEWTNSSSSSSSSSSLTSSSSSSNSSHSSNVYPIRMSQD